MEKRFQSLDEFINESELNEAGPTFDLEDTGYNKDWNKSTITAAQKFKINEPITVESVAGQIDDNGTNLHIKMSDDRFFTIETGFSTSPNPSDSAYIYEEGGEKLQLNPKVYLEQLGKWGNYLPFALIAGLFYESKKYKMPAKLIK